MTKPAWTYQVTLPLVVGRMEKQPGCPIYRYQVDGHIEGTAQHLAYYITPVNADVLSRCL